MKKSSVLETITYLLSPLSSGYEAVESWYSEIKDYNFSRPGFSSKTGESTFKHSGVWLALVSFTLTPSGLSRSFHTGGVEGHKGGGDWTGH